jgi:ABC-2 type transport system permease protein
MTAMARTPAAAPVTAGALPYAGTGTLLSAALRRDRRRVLIWVLALGGVAVYAAVALGAVYPDAAGRQGRATVISTPAGVLLSGPGYGVEHYTLGAMIANELGLSVQVAAAIMSILLVVRHTRAEEESGSAELLLAGAVGRRSPLTTALGLTALANAAVAVVIAAGLAGSGLAPVDSLALAAGVALTGLVFAAVAAVTAQALAQARAASGAALAVLGAAVLVRGVGDLLREHGSWLSWLSPIAWAQQTRAFVDLRWAPLLLPVALTAVLVALAYRLNGRRDVGAGLRAARRGPVTASALLAGPGALLARLQRGTVVGWAVALLLLGATFGSLGNSVTGMVTDNPRLAEAFARDGAGIADSFTAATALYYGLCAAAFAVASVLRLRGEEAAGRVEPLLAAAVDRRRLLGSALGVTVAASVLLLFAAGLGSGLAAAATDGDAGLVGLGVGTALAQLPAVLVVAGVAALLVGAVPRLAGLAWLVVVWALLAGMFGALLSFPAWAVDLSPFGWVPAVPAEPFDVLPEAGLTLVALGLAGLALAAFRRRDVPA